MGRVVKQLVRVHGGADALGLAPHDFSSNANACGPCPQAFAAVAAADPAHYCDPSYAALRQSLAISHDVDPARIVCAGSASEFIFRMTAWAAREEARNVWVPAHGYADYRQAAQAWALALAPKAAEAWLAWACDPSSPFGAADENLQALAVGSGRLILDRAYEPLRLGTAFSLQAEKLDRLWQLWTPNKALGLTGVRAAYAIAPVESQDWVAALDALAPSWVMGAHGVAMLQSWGDPAVQQWLAASRTTLLEWKERQIRLCEALGWLVLPSHANFFVCRVDLAPAAMAQLLTGLRNRGIKLRDCSSFGLPGHLRLSVQPPASQDAFRKAMQGLS